MQNQNSSPVLTNVTISGNSAGSQGGGIVNQNSSTVLTNVTISGNSANNYGGMYNYSSSSPKIMNSIIWGNTAITGPGIFDYSATSTVTYSIVQGGWSGAGGNNSSANPLFVTDVPSSPMPNTGGNLHLQNGSPAIDAGNNTDYPDTWAKWQSLTNTPNPSVIDTEAKYNAWVKDALTKDAGGTARFRPWGGVIDMGAYEEPNGNSTPLSASSAAAFGTALAAVQSGGGTHFTITVSGDISLSPQTLSGANYANKTIVLTSDATDRTITLASAGSLFTVGNNVSLVVEDITLEGISTNNVPLLKVESGGTLTVNAGGVITGNTNAISSAQNTNGGGGVYVDAGASFILDGGTISENTVSCPQNAVGGGVHVLGTFTMYRGSIVDNRTTNTAGAYGANGAGVWVDGNGVFTMMDGTISGNIAHCTGYGRGGGVCVIINTAHFTMQGGSITDNTLSSSSGLAQLGGGLYYKIGTFTQTGGSITGNWSIKGGQAPEVNDIYYEN
jgi:hypothetical protein